MKGGFFMHNLDDLIQNISNNEVRDIPGKLSAEQQRRIESKVLSGLPVVTMRRKPFRKRMVIALAAVLILLIGLTAVAATENEWDIAITNFMELNDPSTLQLESGEVEINTSVSSGGLTITKITSIGDKNSAYIRMDTDYKLPADFDETRDYILPEHNSTIIKDKTSGVPKAFGGVMTCFYENGYLGFLLEISNCDSLNKSHVYIDFKNLILYHDLHVYDDTAPEEELLLEGDWHLDWKYSYKGSTKTYNMLKKVKIGDNTVWLTRIDASPISIRIEGKRLPEEFDQAWGKSSCIQEIGFKDGTVISYPGESSWGHSNTSFDYYIDFRGMEQTINPNELDYMIVGNERIEF